MKEISVFLEQVNQRFNRQNSFRLILAIAIVVAVAFVAENGIELNLMIGGAGNGSTE